MLAYTLGASEKTFSEPPLSYFMRRFGPVGDGATAVPTVPRRDLRAGFLPVTQRFCFRNRADGYILWWLLLALGVFSTFGPGPGSVEGLVYTIIPPLDQIGGLWEVVLQSFLLWVLLWYWVNHPSNRWLT